MSNPEQPAGQPADQPDATQPLEQPEVNATSLPEEPLAQEPASASTTQPQPASQSDSAPTPQQEMDPGLVGEVNFNSIGPGENKNVIQELDYEKLDKDGVPKRGTASDMNPEKETVFFPDLRSASVFHNLDHPDTARTDSPEARRWAAIIQQAPTSSPPGEGFVGVVERSDAEFRQYLGTEKGRLGYSSPSLKDQPGMRYTGERAMLRVRSLMGQGGLVNVPLWHSGFHITLKTPSDSALIETRRRMQNERITLGRHTFGLIFSNTASYTVAMLMDLVMDHVYETSLKDSSDLRSKIDALDLPVLLWGLACAIWPNGFQYARSVSTSDGVLKKEVITGLIDVGKLMWVDNKAFTPKQKAHMSNRMSNIMTPEMVASYKADFPLRTGRKVELGSGISVEFGPPSVEDYIRSGQRWVEKLVSIVEGTLTSDREDIEGRNATIVQHGNATIMRQHGHWVKKIDLAGPEVDDVETIESTLETLSESEEIRKAFTRAYNTYVNDVTVAIIGIPEAAQNDMVKPRFPHLIPIDVVSVFFTLLMQRVNLLENR